MHHPHDNTPHNTETHIDMHDITPHFLTNFEMYNYHARALHRQTKDALALLGFTWA
jgi:hypothetical protein